MSILRGRRASFALAFELRSAEDDDIIELRAAAGEGSASAGQGGHRPGQGVPLWVSQLCVAFGVDFEC